jgi:LCP family protein required for cell wall assembly
MIRPQSWNRNQVSDQLPNFATRFVVRPPNNPKKFTPRHGNSKKPPRLGKIVSFTLKTIAVGLGAILAITGVTAFDVYNQINQDNIVLVKPTVTEDTETEQIETPAGLTGPINMLIVGSDTREGQGVGYGEVESELADVIMMLHISEDRTNASVVSFPRDLLVPIPSCPNPEGGSFSAMSRQMINSSIGYGGVACTHLTVQNFTGLEIPYLAMIDFQGVIEMSNAIGGVEVLIEKPLNDPYTGLNLEAGLNTLQGVDALAFLRARKGIGDGSDLNRISNQQLFLTSLFSKVKTEGVLNNPIYLYSLASAAARNMRLSESMSDLGTMFNLASAMREIDPSQLTFLKIPVRGARGEGEAGRLEPLTAEANKLFEQIRNDIPVAPQEAAQ